MKDHIVFIDDSKSKEGEIKHSLKEEESFGEKKIPYDNLLENEETSGKKNLNLNDNSKTLNTQNTLNNLNTQNTLNNLNQISILADLIKAKIDSENSKSSRVFKILSQIAAIILILLAVALYFKDSVLESQKEFCPTNTSVFKHHFLISNTNDMEDNVKRIVMMNSWIRNLSTSKILEMVEPASFSTLLYGVPGTGKTVFVESLCYKVDLILRKNFLEETADKETLAHLKATNTFDSHIENMASMVEYFCITPALINDKYVGESEKNVKALFSYLYSINDKRKVRIVLFDEAESFFNVRSSKVVNDTNVKCEFLTKISQVPSEFKSVFLFAATNTPETLDAAFMRRFGNKIHFKVPDKDERFKIIQSTLEKCDLTNEQIERIAIRTEGRSQAFIKRTCKKYVEYDEKGEILSYNLDKYIHFLNNMTTHEMF